MKTNIKSYLPYFALALFAGAFSACTDDTYNLDEFDESVNLKYELAMPLIKSTFAIEDAINEYNDDIELKANEDGLLYLEYSKNIEFKDLPEFDVASIDYFSFKQSDPDIPTPIQLSSTPVEFSRNNKIILTEGTGTLDSVYISTGSFGINMQSGFLNNSAVIDTFVLTVNNITKDGKPLVAKLDPHKADSATIDVSGYKIVIDKSNGEEFIPINVTYKLSSDNPTSATIEPEAWLKIDFSKNLALEMISAKLDEAVLIQETLDLELSIFDDDYFSKNEIEFFDPKIYFDIKNYLGVNIYAKFNNAQFANPADNEKVPMSLDINDTISSTSTKRITLNKENTPDLPVILKGIYSHLNLDANISINGLNNGSITFNPDSGAIDLTLTTHLPFWVKLNKVAYEEDVEFDMNSIYDDAGEDSVNIENVEMAYVEVFLTNSYPFEAEAQCYLLDANLVIVDSLFSKGAIKIEGAEGKDDPSEIKAEESSFKIEVNGDKAHKWRSVKTARIAFNASTVDNDLSDPDNENNFKKFYAGQDMSFTLGLHVKGIYDKEEL